MNTKQIQLAVVIIGLSFYSAYAATDDETKLMQENPDWHITTEAYTNPPYWLVPTNVPFRLGPLNNGKWVWTTNAPTGWYEQSTLSVTMDIAREQQIHQQWIMQQWLANNPTNRIIKNNGYSMTYGTNGHLFYVNPNEFWNGVWNEDAHGWRVQLRVYWETNYWYPDVIAGHPVAGVRHPVSTNLMLCVQWGSMVKDSGSGYYMTPNGKFAKFELLDAKGNVIPPNPNAETNLLVEIYNWYQRSAPTISLGPNESSPKILYETNLPSWVAPASGSLTAKFPKTITLNVYPGQEYTGMIGKIECFTNWPPPYLGFLKLDQIYSVTNEGDYTLTVQPVLYKKRIETNILDRVDLPSVTTKVHLVPNVK